MTRDDGVAPELSRMGQESQLPPGLEDRLVNELTERGGIGSKANIKEHGIMHDPRTGGLGRSRAGWMRPAALLAACVALFWLGRTSAPKGAPVVQPEPAGTGGEAAAVGGPTGDPRWMLLLYEDETFQGPPAGREQEYVQEYSRWAQELGESGVVVDGAELLPEGAVVGRGATRTAELRAEGAGRVTGYFVIAAPTLEKAEEIAQGNPHIGHGGKIEVRRMGL